MNVSNISIFQQIYDNAKAKYMYLGFSGAGSCSVKCIIEYELVPIDEIDAVMQFLKYVTQGE